MRTKTILSIIFSVAIGLCGCDYIKESNTSSWPSAQVPSMDRTGELAGIGLPADYFPTDIGHRWSYKITGVTTNDRPVHFTRVMLPAGDDGYRIVQTRGIIYNWKNPESTPDKEMKLVLSIEGLAEKQGMLNYPEGYKLKIIRDDLNYYDDATGTIFWAVSKQPRYDVMEIVMIDPQSSSSLGNTGPWGSMNAKEGMTLNMKFFGEKPMISITLNNSPESLLFVGFENLNGIKSLHFRREVAADDREKSEIKRAYFSQPFTEDVWYGKGLGLMKLVQTVGGKVTMVWDLEL